MEIYMGLEDKNKVEKRGDYFQNIEFNVLGNFSERFENLLSNNLNIEYGSQEKDGERYIYEEYIMMNFTEEELNNLPYPKSRGLGDLLIDEDVTKLKDNKENILVAKYLFNERRNRETEEQDESIEDVDFAELYVFEGHGKLKCKIRDIKMSEIKISDWQFREMVIKILSNDFPLSYIEKESDQEKGLLVFDLNHDKIIKDKLEKERVVIIEKKNRLDDEEKKLDESKKIEEEKRLAIEEKKKEIIEINFDNQNDNESKKDIVDSIIITNKKSENKGNGNLFKRVIGWFKKK